MCCDKARKQKKTKAGTKKHRLRVVFCNRKKTRAVATIKRRVNNMEWTGEKPPKEEKPKGGGGGLVGSGPGAEAEPWGCTSSLITVLGIILLLFAQV